ncbi:hypothetical protein AAE478_004960 [Parahypoxylon ruwenzoriense]
MAPEKHSYRRNEDARVGNRCCYDRSRRWRLALALSLAFLVILSLRLWDFDIVSIAPSVKVAPIAKQFELYEHLGNLSPFFVPSNTPDSLKEGTPPGCTVSKAFLIHRHGSRHPHPNELEVIQSLSSYLSNNSALLSNPRKDPPNAWSFLTKGWNNTFDTDDLTAPGRQQLFDHGVALRLRYPDLYAETDVLAAAEDRVLESAKWFMDGYYGRNSSATLTPVAEDENTVSWLTPYETCPKWTADFGNGLVSEWGAIYLPPIAKRINKALSKAYPEVNFTAEHVHGMLYACAYGTSAYGVGSSPWCPVFRPEDIIKNEYEYDLRMRGFAGYGLPGHMGPVLGSLLVSNVTGFLERDSGPKLSFSFGHDKTIALGLTALGLASDECYPTTGPVNPHRAWKSAEQTPFAAYMLWKRLECHGEDRIQLVLNDANFGLSPIGCKSDKYGSCAFGDFLSANRVQAALNVTRGDERWAAACRL